MEETARVIKELTAYPTEEEWLEFKTNWFEPHALGEYISALSNAAALKGRKEAYLVWGINDATHEIVGTTFNPHLNVKGEPLEHFLARKISPDTGFRFTETQLSGKPVVLLTIPAAQHAPTAFEGIRYTRIGSSKVNLARFPDREGQLFDVLRHGLPTLENTESDYQDLSFGQLFTYYAGRGIELNRQTFESNLRLRTDRGAYNMLAQLLSDNSHIPIRVSIFNGEDKSAPLFSVREFGNACLLVSLDKIIEYGDVLNLVQADESNRMVERQDTRLFSPDAYREAIVNAFVHNRWIDGNAPMVTVYSDRLEILSRGTLAPAQTMEGFFLGESVPVNRSLSDIFLQLRISERSGRGIPKITREYGRGAFEFRENSIALTIPFQVVKSMKPILSKTPKGEIAKLNNTQSRILQEMRNNPNVTQVQLMEIVGLGEAAIQRNVSFLRRNKFIKRIGSNKSGYWEVIS